MNDRPANQNTTDGNISGPDAAGSSAAIRRRLVLLVVIAAGLAFFSVTSPKSVPSLLLIVGFAVLGAMLCAGWQLLLMLTGLRSRLPAPYRRGIVLAGTVLPVLLLMLQSIGQLTVRDALALGGLFVIGIFYASRLTARPENS